MRIAVVADGEGGGWLRELGEGGAAAPPRRVRDLAAAVRSVEESRSEEGRTEQDGAGREGAWETGTGEGVGDRTAAASVRWVWADTGDVYPDLVRAGVRVARCHDVGLTEALLLGYGARHSEPHSLGAAWARLHDLAVPDDPVRPLGEGTAAQPALFEADRSTLPPGTDRLAALAEVHDDQRGRVAALPEPGRMALLIAVESAGALAAVEMSHDGLPWRPDVHDQVLTEILGPRPRTGERPAVLADLVTRIGEVVGHEVNPDSPAQVLRAMAWIGHPVESTRSWVLEAVDHPLVPLLLRYKELARLYSANGWSWLETWVRELPREGGDGPRLGRFQPDYVVGGVVSGRWASRGGGALQIPKSVRRAVRADPGWVLVRADAGQLEPRVLAAVSGDTALAAAAAEEDLYTRLAVHVGDDRERAKIGLLAAMYGQTSGDAAPLLATMRRLYPRALEYVDAAARTGEGGGIVRSWLGRTSPAPHDWSATVAATDGDRRRRAHGRFTRNFVVQATAAEWALVLLAALRQELPATPDGGGIVFFVHDEVVLHVPEHRAAETLRAIDRAQVRTREILFGETPVRFPLTVSVTDCYADL
ncbi:bifunctional 3'-5' exonuclease/DNA polymerase [Nocardiopsis sp. B62]|uniref:bifunctional 3'-5' exonuclease/DNA polymerase n=1 Tax=Nocardiopsis sp. B62 TaxID=2824874 RepID=UPI001B397F85|nr:bifunctional 3'-5' exonuclease/DNA polymerase [Nocardiopsis sp. B62]MBQ1082946.1 bifunctional 3'-5' exonuclease/DNA polymerase [Nocardiopsis sp. B62]